MDDDGKTYNFVFSARITKWSDRNFVFSGSIPQMKVQLEGFGTWLLFRTGSCRLLGCPSIALSETAKKKLEQKFAIVVEHMRLTNFTYIFKVPFLNTMTEVYQFLRVKKTKDYSSPLYWPELFNALSLKVGTINVNIFHTGSVVVTGMKDVSQISNIRSVVFTLVTEALVEL